MSQSVCLPGTRTVVCLALSTLGMAACVPIEQASLAPAAPAAVEPSARPIEPTRSQVPPTDPLPAVTATADEVTGWPTYVLNAELPNAPSEVRVYTQTLPSPLAADGDLEPLWQQLQMTGTVSSRIDEGGDRVVSLESADGSAAVWSERPLMLTLQNGTLTSVGPLATPRLSLERRIALATDYLNARGLLDFPYRMEAPVLSRNRNTDLRVVPLIDGIPLADYDALNGRLLVQFSPTDDVAVVFWRPLTLEPGDAVAVLPAAAAWDALQRGATPTSDKPGQCWQTAVLDPAEPYGTASPIGGSACVGYSSGPIKPYKGATITQVELVYFARDLNLGMSPFAFPADSPARLVYPMWQFTGVTDDARAVQILWPAMAP